MKDEEKKLIENLFHRLKNTELNSSERDDSANSLIQDLVKKQPYSSYYMTQTILIQETAIKKLSLKVEELKNKISALNHDKVVKKPSFLSNFFKKEPLSPEICNDSNIWKKNQHIQGTHNPLPVSSPTISNSGTSSFLKNALQTATGVAGGMILGNMLMNIFHHSKPEEEIFDTINESSFISDIEENSFQENNDHNLVNYNEQDDLYISENTSDFNSHDINDINDMNDMSDMNDDNFI